MTSHTHPKSKINKKEIIEIEKEIMFWIDEKKGFDFSFCSSLNSVSYNKNVIEHSNIEISVILLNRTINYPIWIEDRQQQYMCRIYYEIHLQAYKVQTPILIPMGAFISAIWQAVIDGLKEFYRGTLCSVENSTVNFWCLKSSLYLFVDRQLTIECLLIVDRNAIGILMEWVRSITHSFYKFNWQCTFFS